MLYELITYNTVTQGPNKSPIANERYRWIVWEEHSVYTFSPNEQHHQVKDVGILQNLTFNFIS